MIEKDSEVKVVILFVDHVPTTKVKILVHRKTVLVFEVVYLVEATDIFGIKFFRDLSQIYIRAQGRLHAGDLVNFNYCLNKLGLKLLLLFD